MVPFKIIWALWFLQEVGLVCCVMLPHLSQRKGVVEGEEGQVERPQLLKSQAEPWCEHITPHFPLLLGWSRALANEAEFQTA